MEDLIGSLREQLRSQTQPPSPTSAARHLSSATQIENEALREQVVHLQKKLTIMEDMLEEVRATAERDETMVREKIRRYREKEDLLRQQVSECESEIARLVKSENNARARTEEVGEALRESTVALENARAEIEGLRAEIVVRNFHYFTEHDNGRFAGFGRRCGPCLHRFGRSVLRTYSALNPWTHTLHRTDCTLESPARRSYGGAPRCGQCPDVFLVRSAARDYRRAFDRENQCEHVCVPVSHRLRVFLARNPSTRLGGQTR